MIVRWSRVRLLLAWFLLLSIVIATADVAVTSSASETKEEKETETRTTDKPTTTAAMGKGGTNKEASSSVASSSSLVSEKVPPKATTASSTTSTTTTSTSRKPTTAELQPIVLDGTTFDDQVSDGSIWLIEFYAPWCSHCSSFIPTYIDLAKHFHTRNIQHENDKVSFYRNIKIAKVNGDDEKSLSNRFGIYGYPTFYLVDGWSVYEFDGVRSFKGLRDWVNGGYLDDTPMPFYSSPFGPLGLAQGAMVRSGMSIRHAFQALQNDYGLSQLMAGAVLFGSFYLGSFVVIVFCALNVKTKSD